MLDSTSTDVSELLDSATEEKSSSDDADLEDKHQFRRGGAAGKLSVSMHYWPPAALAASAPGFLALPSTRPGCTPFCMCPFPAAPGCACAPCRLRCMLLGRILMYWAVYSQSSASLSWQSHVELLGLSSFGIFCNKQDKKCCFNNYG
ncbi:hypothetical protein BaRGS_00033079 [Batillaria attramentaria]|uniref:Uncharacterized protein n=1 Tax=Batillaria attramentaria TaxID=370345 RepID=A0ABD0JLI2_9CAEN